MSDIVVRPVRFTDRVDEMREFLQVLGLRPRLESDHGGWVDMVAGSGMIALHSAEESARGAPSGLTSLSFEADDIDAVAGRLRDAGVGDVAVYDEAYGRVLACRDPLGHEIAVDEAQDDLYGYRAHDPVKRMAGVTVVTVRFCRVDGPYGAFLRALGLRPRGEAGVVDAYEPAPGHGQVLLHPPTEGMPPFADEPGAARLSFEWGEPATNLADRLTAAGHEAEVVHQDAGDVLRTVDPDGLVVEVYPSRRGDS